MKFVAKERDGFVVVADNQSDVDNRLLHEAALALSVDDRGQESPLRLVVEADAHERHWLHDTKSMLQAPAKRSSIACRQEEAWATELGSVADQGPQSVVAFADGMTREPDPGRVTGETIGVFHNGSPSSFDRLRELDAPVVAVHANTQRITLVDVALRRAAHCISGQLQGQRGSLHGDERLADLKPQFCIQGQGTGVIRGLNQPHPGIPALGNALENRLHETAPDHPALGRGIDGDARNARNRRRALVEEGAPDNTALELGDY